MRFAKKAVVLMLAFALVLGLFESVQLEAKEIGIPTPKVTVKTTNKNTGVKLTIAKTKDAESYEVVITGKAVVNKNYRSDVVINDDTQNADDISVTEYINLDGKAQRTLAVKYLPEGTYTVKVRSKNSKKFGTTIYSEYTKEKNFKLKAQTSKGYSSSYNLKKVKQGDVVKFGSYEQDLNYTNGKEPIEWIVLEKNKKSVLLVSKYALDLLPYNIERKDVTWESCSLRKWLNKAFIDTAFNKKEKGMIKTTTVENYDNAVFKTAAGKDTKDKVFLLSQLEMINTDFGFADNYYSSDIKRRCAYAWNKGKTDDGYWIKTSDNEPACSWWLRSPGDNAHKACYVDNNGSVNSNGSLVDNDYSLGVRPALYINL